MPRAEARKHPMFMAELDELLPDRTPAAEIASYLCRDVDEVEAQIASLN